MRTRVPKWSILAIISVVSLECVVLVSCAAHRLDLRLVNAEILNGSNTRAVRENRVDSEVMFVAVGDIMLSRGVARAIDAAGRPEYPFTKLSDVLLSSDFNFGNLEGPISGNDRRTGKGLIFNTRRDHVKGLTTFNFKVISLANNHALDQGLKSLRFTRQFLDQMGIQYVGAGDDLARAWEPAVMTANGIRIAFVGASYTSYNDGGASRSVSIARMEDESLLRASMQKARSESDLVVVSMHAGNEYTRKPNRSQIAFAKAAIDAGADVVIGSHPHWIQRMEFYRGRPIFYSLGNFIFDQPWPETRTGLMLKVIVKKQELDEQARIDQIDMLPVLIERGAPRLASKDEAAAILRRIGIENPVIRLNEQGQ